MLEAFIVGLFIAAVYTLVIELWGHLSKRAKGKTGEPIWFLFALAVLVVLLMGR